MRLFLIEVLTCFAHNTYAIAGKQQNLLEGKLNQIEACGFLHTRSALCFLSFLIFNFIVMESVAHFFSAAFVIKGFFLSENSENLNEEGEV